MGARWRMAIAATALIALCTLAVVAADSETGSITEAVRLRFDEGRRQFNNYQEPESERFQSIREEEEGASLPRLATISHTALDAMGPSRQRAMLRKLAAEKRRLSRILRRGRDTDDADDWETQPERAHESAWTPRRKAEMFEDEPVSHSRPPREESDEQELVEHSSAMFRAAMQAEVKQRAKDRKRQAAIERDEEELEEEQADAFRVKLQEKSQKNRAQKVRLMRQVQHYKRRDRLDQQMIREAQKEAATSAAQAAHDAATRVAGQMEHELLSDVRATLPDQLAQQRMRVSGAVQDHDLVRLQPEAVQTTAQATDAAANRDPVVKRLVRKIARLQRTLKKTTTSQQPESATANANQAAQPAYEEAVVDPLIMETDSATTEKPQIAVEPKKARIVVSQKPKSARVVAPPAQPMASSPAEPAEEEPSVVDIVPEKPLREPVQVEEKPTVAPEPIIEGENEEEAEVNLIAYALWGSVGALVVGLLGTVVYCACQQPRDRPWGMPPKRQF